MENIRDWAFNICVTLIVTGIFGMLVPKGSFEKIIKFTVSLFFITCLITPFIKGSLNTDMDFGADFSENLTADEITDVVHNQIKSVASIKLKRELEKILTESGINFTKTEININIDDESRISINNISIILDESKKETETIKKTEELILKEMGIRPEIK